MAPGSTGAVKRPWLGLTAIGLAVLAPAMDTAVNIALPGITQAFGLDVRAIQWVVVCYMLVYGALMLTCGRLGDLVGHARVFRAGLAVTAVSFVVSTWAPTYPLLLAGRALQGVGIALVLSCGPALVTSLFDESFRTRVLGIYGSMFAAGTALGPLLGGWLMQFGGWSVVFAMRLPLVLAALALSFALPGRPPRGPVVAGKAAFDWPGAILLVVWMSALLLACAGPFDLGPDLPPYWPPWAQGRPLGWLLLATGLAALAAFVAHEARTAAPIIRPSLFRSGPFAVLNVASLLVNVASFAVLLLTPYFLLRWLGLSATVGGALLAMSGVGAILGSWTTGWLGGRIAPRRLAFAGIVIAGASLVAIGRWDAGTPALVIGGCLLLQGFGVGLFNVAYTDAVLAALPIADRGVAGSLAMMTRSLGIMGGATGLSALFQALQADAMSGGLAAGPAFLSAYQTAFTVAGGTLLAALALTLACPRLWSAKP